MASDWFTDQLPQAALAGGWDPSTFAGVVGRAPTAAETAYYAQTGPNWLTEVIGNTPDFAARMAGGAPTPGVAGPLAGGGGTGPYTGNPTDRQAIAAWFQQLGSLPGADPSLAQNPDYWAGRAIETGGLRPDNSQYWQDAGVGDTAFFRHPDRESGGGGGGASRTATGPAPTFSYGDFVAPDPSQVGTDPWTQYTLQTQQDAIQKSAAARGMLTTGGTIHDLLTNATDVANQGYQGIYSRALQTYGANQGNALNAYSAAAHNYDQAQQYDWAGTLLQNQQQQDQWANKFKLLGLV